MAFTVQGYSIAVACGHVRPELHIIMGGNNLTGRGAKVRSAPSLGDQDLTKHIA